MKTLRYQTWRRSVTLGSVLLMLSFAGMIASPKEGWGTACEILFWATIILSVGFQLAVAILRKLGILEFTYTDTDQASYLYNAERLHQQMKDFRRSRKRD